MRRKDLFTQTAFYNCKSVEVRGLGLINGMVLTIPPRKVVDACFERGLLVASAGYDVLRFVPPLVVQEKDIDKALSIVERALASLL